MADQDNLDLGPETQDFDDSEFTLDLGSAGDEDDERFLKYWDELDSDLFFDPYMEYWDELDSDRFCDSCTEYWEREAWDDGPDYYLDEFDY